MSTGERIATTTVLPLDSPMREKRPRPVRLVYASN